LSFFYYRLMPEK